MPVHSCSITPNSMCKRAVEKYRNEPKRARNEKPTYTQGPLDEVFGQHRAFPTESEGMPDEMSEVHKYLASVRREAENDSVCHYTERNSNPAYTPGQNLSLNRTERGNSPLSRQYISGVIDQLNDAKQKNLTASQETVITISASQFDLETHSDTEEDQDEEEVLEDVNSCGSATNSDQQTAESGYIEKSSSGPGFPEIPDSAVKWRQLVFTTPAPPQEFFQEVLEHPTVIKLIVYYTKWLSAAMPSSLPEWIFATFVRLDCGLDHQELAIVRALGLKAQKLREKFIGGAAEGANVPSVAQSCVDMILAVVSQYYGQKDLICEI